LCGRFEGFDARVEAMLATGSISVGPYVLAGGEVAALAVVEAVIRHLPGSLGNTDSVIEESFSEGLEGMVEYPHYTRPREYDGMEVPSVLLSGDHGAIARWRRENARPSPWERQAGHGGPKRGIAAENGGEDK
jgi:tRNA (guanine37-N1)-methyltransferase